MAKPSWSTATRSAPPGEEVRQKREALMEIINNTKASDEDRFAARLKLQQLPRDANRRACATAAR